MRPTSDSSTFALTCIFVRSAAMMNSVGAFMLAATVWPTSTLREMTMPSMGASMTVCSRLTSFWLSEACDCVTARLRRLDLGLGRPHGHLGGLEVLRRHELARRPGSRSASASLCASSSATFRRSRSACARTRFARACSIWVWSSDGSSSATTWPFFTIELKSAYSALMLPDTCEPDLHRRHGLERAGGADRLDDVAAGHGAAWRSSPLRRGCGTCSTRRRNRR